MISARGVSKKFGTITALDSVDFEIGAGEFVFLTGPSGSGKTTVLRLILREIKPDKGVLSVDGHDLAKIHPHKLPIYRRALGMVFQDFKLLIDKSLAENVALPLLVRGVKDSEITKDVKSVLEVVGLTGRANLFPAQLSGGELQRAAIARAIVGRPKLILADEPTGNLDPKTAKSIVKLLHNIHKELKTCVIMATHNADIVNTLSQRVISLDEGKIIKDSQKGRYE
ncbi:MAG: ATP-binding cassette domain-containing protein [bacterium]|nr:ATP-binding cassette domain-containing protein [bacterium]